MKIGKHQQNFYEIIIEFILMIILGVWLVLSKIDTQQKLLIAAALALNVLYSIYKLIRQLNKEKQQ